jgi:ribosomal protein S27AE
MGKHKSQEEVEQIIYKRCKEMNYILLEPFKYKNNLTKIHLKCPIDNHEWYVNYDSYIRLKTDCPKCKGNAKPTQKEAEKLVNDKCIKMNYTLTEPFIYKNAYTKIHIKCNIDNYNWFVIYRHFIKDNRNCPKCSNHPRISQKEVENNILMRCKEMNYTLLEPFIYKNCDIKNIKLKCNNDNYEWCITYFNFINMKNKCPKCAKEIGFETCIKHYGEAFLHLCPKHNPNSIIYLNMISEKLNITIQHALNGGEKKFQRYWIDGYIEQYNICIEWDEKHHNNKKIKQKDIKNDKFLISNFNCKIIRINEKEFLQNINDSINIVL